MIALQARMQASYQDHVAQTQRLNAKVGFHKQIFPHTRSVCLFISISPLSCSFFITVKIPQILSLQEQLEKGPNAQLARLQQENSILRDALNQATSQAESK